MMACVVCSDLGKENFKILHKHVGKTPNPGWLSAYFETSRINRH